MGIFIKGGAGKGGGGLESVVAGTGISVDVTDPDNPIVSSTVTDTNDKAKVSSNDTTAGYLNGKLVAGSGITLTEGNNGGDETLTIAASGGGGGSTVTEYTVTTNDAENTTSQITVLTFTIPANTFGDGDVVWWEIWCKQLESTSTDSVTWVYSITGLSDTTFTISGNQTSVVTSFASAAFKRYGTTLQYQISNQNLQYRPDLNGNAITWSHANSYDFTSDIVVSIKATHSVANPSNYIRVLHSFAGKQTVGGVFR